MPETDLISIRVGLDKNKDGKFDELREPYKLYKYSISSLKYSEFVPNRFNEALQKLIEK